MNYFSVKTFYRVKTKGSVKIRHKCYEKDSFLIEERVVLFKAKGEKEALKKAEKEAAEYASESYQNPFGQEVHFEYLGICDVFELFEDIENGVEVFSTNDVVREKTPVKNILKSRMGDEDRLTDKKRRELRVKFLNKDFTPNIDEYISGKLSKK